MKQYDAAKVERTIDQGAVKLHIFQPSGRKVWTVVGKDDEHWADPELQFCSCKNYYYKTLSSGEICYHLKSVQQAMQDNKFIRTEFDDAEYVGFLKVLLVDNSMKLLS
jgi:predicted nucleic acid-binding Zn finger protein